MISVVGGIIMDIKGLPSEPPVAGSYTPGRIQFSPGGVARNIAENLARLSVPVQLFGIIGKDPAGQQLIDATTQAGVQTAGMMQHPTLPSPTDVSIFDAEGELLYSVTELETMNQLSIGMLEPHLPQLLAAKMLLLDTNLPLPTMQYLLEQANQRNLPVLIEPVSVSQAKKINQLKGEIWLATPNQLEVKVISRSVEHVLISRGKLPLIWKRGEIEQAFPVQALDNIQNSVGAGDSFVAGLVAALYQGNSMEVGIAWGIAAARLTLQSEKAVSPEMHLDRLTQS